MNTELNTKQTDKNVSQAKMPHRIAVLCIGNILMLDDGVGPRMASELNARFTFPAGVEILDRAVMGMALLSELSSYDIILVVDAVDNTGQPPGTVVSFAPEDVASYQSFHGAHDTRFVDVLQAAALLGYHPQGHCLGVQVGNSSPADYQIGLTPEVEAALPLLAHAILSFLKSHGVVATDQQTATPWQGE